MQFIAIIPARYASTRFPGKPLALLAGKPVIQHVYEQVTKVLPEAWVATDDSRIFDAVERFGGKAVMTRADHKSGTDRIEEATEKIGANADVIVNVQGDEPFIQPSQIETLCALFDNPDSHAGKALHVDGRCKEPQLTKDRDRQQWVRALLLALCHSFRARQGRRDMARQLSLPQASGHLRLSARRAARGDEPAHVVA